MITYVHCLSPEPVVSCWDKACYEVPSGEKQTICSVQTNKKMGNSLQHPTLPSPRPGGCLRKHLLSMSKVHQRPGSLWTPKPLLGPVSKGGPRKMHQDGKGRGWRGYITDLFIRFLLSYTCYCHDFIVTLPPTFKSLKEWSQNKFKRALLLRLLPLSWYWRLSEPLSRAYQT